MRRIAFFGLVAVIAVAAPLAAKPGDKITRPAVPADVSGAKPSAKTNADPTQAVVPPATCPQPQGGEAAADWKPPPIPPKDDPGSIGPQGGKAAADWRPPPIPPHDPNQRGCVPQAAESADWRPPPIPPKR